MKVLHIDSSINGQSSVTKHLTAYAIKKLKELHTNIEVIYHDLNDDPLPHINLNFIRAARLNDLQVTSNQLLISNKLIEELKAVDIIIIGAPMYNFSIPSQLKAWIDYICLSGKTFKYSDKGAQGLVNDKKTLIAVATGGFYSEGPMKSNDHVTSYMKQIFQFIGINNVSIALAEKQGFGKEIAEKEVLIAQNIIDSFAKK